MGITPPSAQGYKKSITRDTCSYSLTSWSSNPQNSQTIPHLDGQNFSLRSMFTRTISSTRCQSWPRYSSHMSRRKCTSRAVNICTEKMQRKMEAIYVRQYQGDLCEAIWQQMNARARDLVDPVPILAEVIVPHVQQEVHQSRSEHLQRKGP